MFVQNRYNDEGGVYMVVIDEFGEDVFCILPDRAGTHYRFIIEYSKQSEESINV